MNEKLSLLYHLLASANFWKKVHKQIVYVGFKFGNKSSKVEMTLNLKMTHKNCFMSLLLSSIYDVLSQDHYFQRIPLLEAMGRDREREREWKINLET